MRVFLSIHLHHPDSQQLNIYHKFWNERRYSQYYNSSHGKLCILSNSTSLIPEFLLLYTKQFQLLVFFDCVLRYCQWNTRLPADIKSTRKRMGFVLVLLMWSCRGSNRQSVFGLIIWGLYSCLVWINVSYYPEICLVVASSFIEFFKIYFRLQTTKNVLESVNSRNYFHLCCFPITPIDWRLNMLACAN